MPSDWWYLSPQDEQKGPLPQTEFFASLAKDPSWRKILVWRLGMKEWKEAGLLREIVDAMQAKPSPFPAKHSVPDKSKEEDRQIAKIIFVLVVAIISLGLLGLIAQTPSSPISSSKLDLYGVAIGSRAEDAGRKLVVMMRELKGIRVVHSFLVGMGSSVEIQDWGQLYTYQGVSGGRITGHVNDATYFYASAADISFAEDPDNGSVVVGRLVLSFVGVDQDFILSEMTKKFGAASQVYGQGAWCAGTTKWIRGTTSIEVCRKSSLTVGDMDITMDDEAFRTRAINAAQARRGGGSRPKL